MTELNAHTIGDLKLWLQEFEKMINNKPDVLFMHIHVDNINKTISTEIKLAKE